MESINALPIAADVFELELQDDDPLPPLAIVIPPQPEGTGTGTGTAERNRKMCKAALEACKIAACCTLCAAVGALFFVFSDALYQ